MKKEDVFVHSARAANAGDAQGWQARRSCVAPQQAASANDVSKRMKKENE
jgi:hypothetical protein